MKLRSFLFLLMVPVLASCAAKTSRVDVDSDDSGSTETSSKDLRTVAYEMAGSLLQLPQIQNASKPPTIAFADVKNETNELINKNMFVDKMRTLLIKNAQGKMMFLDRELSREIENERSKKRSGDISSGDQKKILGADYFLTGKLSSIDKVSGSKRSTYTRYAFRLTDAESTAILWEDEYEVKKVGKAGLYDQ